MGRNSFYKHFIPKSTNFLNIKISNFPNYFKQNHNYESRYRSKLKITNIILGMGLFGFADQERISTLDKAIYKFKESYKILDEYKINDFDLYFMNYYYIGISYFEKKDFDNSLTYFENALENLGEENIFFLPLILKFIGNIYIIKNQISEGCKLYHLSISIIYFLLNNNNKLDIVDKYSILSDEWIEILKKTQITKEQKKLYKENLIPSISISSKTFLNCSSKNPFDSLDNKFLDYTFVTNYSNELPIGYFTETNYEDFGWKESDYKTYLKNKTQVKLEDIVKKNSN